MFKENFLIYKQPSMSEGSQIPNIDNLAGTEKTENLNGNEIFVLTDEINKTKKTLSSNIKELDELSTELNKQIISRGLKEKPKSWQYEKEFTGTYQSDLELWEKNEKLTKLSNTARELIKKIENYQINSRNIDPEKFDNLIMEISAFIYSAKNFTSIKDESFNPKVDDYYKKEKTKSSEESQEKKDELRNYLQEIQLEILSIKENTEKLKSEFVKPDTMPEEQFEMKVSDYTSLINKTNELSSNINSLINNSQASIDFLKSNLTDSERELAAFKNEQEKLTPTNTVKEALQRWVEGGVGSSISFGIDEVEAMPTEEAEAMPTDEVEAVPTDEAEAVPTEESEAVPTEEAEAMPTEESEAVPTDEAEAEAVPTEEAEAIPTEEAEAMPIEEAEAVPTDEAKAVPTDERLSSIDERIESLPPESQKIVKELQSTLNLSAPIHPEDTPNEAVDTSSQTTFTSPSNPYQAADAGALTHQRKVIDMVISSPISRQTIIPQENNENPEPIQERIEVPLELESNYKIAEIKGQKFLYIKLNGEKWFKFPRAINTVSGGIGESSNQLFITTETGSTGSVTMEKNENSEEILVANFTNSEKQSMEFIYKTDNDTAKLYEKLPDGEIQYGGESFDEKLTEIPPQNISLDDIYNADASKLAQIFMSIAPVFNGINARKYAEKIETNIKEGNFNQRRKEEYILKALRYANDAGLLIDTPKEYSTVVPEGITYNENTIYLENTEIPLLTFSKTIKTDEGEIGFKPGYKIEENGDISIYHAGDKYTLSMSKSQDPETLKTKSIFELKKGEEKLVNGELLEDGNGKIIKNGQEQFIASGSKVENEDEYKITLESQKSREMLKEAKISISKNSKNEYNINIIASVFEYDISNVSTELVYNILSAKNPAEMRRIAISAIVVERASKDGLSDIDSSDLIDGLLDDSEAKDLIETLQTYQNEVYTEQSELKKDVELISTLFEAGFEINQEQGFVNIDGVKYFAEDFYFNESGELSDEKNGKNLIEYLRSKVTPTLKPGYIKYRLLVKELAILKSKHEERLAKIKEGTEYVKEKMSYFYIDSSKEVFDFSNPPLVDAIILKLKEGRNSEFSQIIESEFMKKNGVGYKLVEHLGKQSLIWDQDLTILDEENYSLTKKEASIQYLSRQIETYNPDNILEKLKLDPNYQQAIANLESDVYLNDHLAEFKKKQNNETAEIIKETFEGIQTPEEYFESKIYPGVLMGNEKAFGVKASIENAWKNSMEYEQFTTSYNVIQEKIAELDPSNSEDLKIIEEELVKYNQSIDIKTPEIISAIQFTLEDKIERRARAAENIEKAGGKLLVNSDGNLYAISYKGRKTKDPNEVNKIYETAKSISPQAVKEVQEQLNQLT